MQTAQQTSPPGGPMLAISATFTADSIADTLQFWMAELGFSHPIQFAPYNQVFQQFLDPASLLARNRHGINVVIVRAEDWTRFREAPEAAVLELEKNVRHFLSCLQAASSSFSSPLLLCLCPASPAFLSDPRRADSIRSQERLLEEAARELGAVHIVTSQELEDLYPVASLHDEHGETLGHIPYTPAYFAALGTMVARKIHAMRATPYKVIALDCDETLWRGICGEDGPEGVVIDPSRRALQEFMLAQREAGMLLCLCSKNNEEDVLETFRVHPEMPLRLEHFVSRRINWEAKSVNLADLAEELGLGLGSFVFLDDNAEECAEVQASRPEVLSLCLPPKAEDIPRFLKHVWAFDHLKITEEDRKRTALYTQRIERARLQKEASSLAEFIASLKLEIRISPMSPSQLPRVSQLTQRTNQMNVTTIRRTESEIQNLLRSGEAECLTVDVRDRFGSYGLTGVVIYRPDRDSLDVDTFLLSCRVLGRGVEHRLLARLGEIAGERGLREVVVPYKPTRRNRPALRFLESAGSEYREAGDSETVFRFPADYARQIRYEPESEPPGASSIASGGRESSEPVRPEAADFARIAAQLRDAERILEVVKQRNHKTIPRSTAPDAPRTDLEEQVAAIWADLLGVPSVGIHDNFFDLGGHSLLAVQLLSRVRQAFHADLTLEVVYSSAFTVAELAKAIEVREIEQAGADQYADILKELEGLSDEEVQALLAQEQGGPEAKNPN